ncbi:type II secretion system F family protein [Rhodoblastus sp.]|uniref:type II secretion system F family protein n=1 Tax=Rhodoblastus sp. TaxID=1962975 RepID=UPI002628FF58|nr:type II secretion system F family protein [Rhodoblastus sp.]
MRDDLQIWVMFGSMFIAVVSLTVLAGSAIVRRQKLRARLADNSFGDESLRSGGSLRQWWSKVSSVEDKLVGFDDEGQRSKARMELIRAGFFSPDSAKTFIVIRAGLTLLLPAAGVLVIAPFFHNITTAGQYILALFMLFLGYTGPDAYLKRRQRMLMEEYRNVFPDVLDLLVVCMDAGSSINAALERVGRDIALQSKALGINVQLLVSEMRSGRSLVDALNSFTSRVSIDEAASFSALIKQSVELGSDVSEAMRVYSDEMREKRLSRAEEKAHALPVKMVLPLGLFIFPVILITILTPALIKISTALGIVMQRGH